MHIFTTAADWRTYTETARCAGRRLGLVPTMGALHQGHLELVRRAAMDCDEVLATIFVNPTQFNNPDDLLRYPRLPEQDAALLAPAGCTALFMPATVQEMYPQPTVLRFNFGPLESVMEGAHRPGHFNGVATVVSKLFHQARPHRAYFGQKDFQQVAIVRQLIADLGFDLELVVCPTVREADGLAMSSRNLRLSPEARAVAPLLYKALRMAAYVATRHTETIANGRDYGLMMLASEPSITVEYFEIADAQTLQPIEEYKPGRSIVLCVAAFLDGVRLIDNVVVTA